MRCRSPKRDPQPQGVRWLPLCLLPPPWIQTEVMGTQQPHSQDGEALGARSPACFWLSLISGIVFAAGLTEMDSSHLGTWGWHFNSGLVGREPGAVGLVTGVPGGPESFAHLCTEHRVILSGAVPPSFLSLSPPHLSSFHSCLSALF